MTYKKCLQDAGETLLEALKLTVGIIVSLALFASVILFVVVVIFLVTEGLYWRALIFVPIGILGARFLIEVNWNKYVECGDKQ